MWTFYVCGSSILTRHCVLLQLWCFPVTRWVSDYPSMCAYVMDLSFRSSPNANLMDYPFVGGSGHSRQSCMEIYFCLCRSAWNAINFLKFYLHFVHIYGCALCDYRRLTWDNCGCTISLYVGPLAPLVLPTHLPSTVHFSAASTPPRVLLPGFEKLIVVSSASWLWPEDDFYNFSSALFEQKTNSCGGCSALGLSPGGILSFVWWFINLAF